MKLRLKRVLMLNLLLAHSISVATAADAEFCNNYVLSSIAQYWRSVDNNCGFTSDQWSSDVTAHTNWCLSEHQWVAEGQISSRKKQLEKCSPATETNVIDAKKVIVPEGQKPISIGEDFLRAVAADDVDKAKQLVKEGASVDFKTQDAALIKELGMAYHKKESPSESGDKNDAKDLVISDSALSFAVSKNLLNVGLWLLDENIDGLPDSKIKHSRKQLLGNALVEAVKQKNLAAIERFLDIGASVDYEVDSNSGTPLYFAVMKGSLEMASLLIDKGANTRYSTNGGENMLNLALESLPLLELLLLHKADPNSNGELTGNESLPVVKAIASNNGQALDLLLKYGANADIADYDSPYPLIVAIKNNKPELVKILLNHGANVNVVYNSGSPGKCIKGEKNITPSSAALELNDEIINAALKAAKAKSLDVLCP